MKKERKSPTQKSPEILIAEDSLTQATQIKYLLESNHYIVTVAQNGKQALDWLSKHKPSLVISDILMPGINGYELCKKIKSNKVTEDIPVILLTRLYDPEEIIEGLSCGADSFITKPYNEKHLLSNIEKLLSAENGDDYQKVPFGVQILFNGEKRTIQAEQQNVIKLMLDIYEGAIYQNEKLIQTQEELRLLNEQLESIVEERTSDLTAEIKLSNQIAERLKKSEEKYCRIFENVQDSYYETSIDGTILEVSSSIEILSKGLYHRDDFIGKSMYNFYFDNNERASLLSQLMEKGVVSDFEIKLKNRDGSLIPCSISSKISFDALGRPVNIIGSMRDITERKKAEEALQHSLVFSESLLNTIPFGMDIVDETGTVLFQSDSFKRLFREEAIGKKCWEIFRDDKTQCPDCPLIKGITIGETEVYESHGVLGNRIFEIIHTGMLYKGEKAMLEIFQDITARKENEEELIQSKEKAEESDRLKTAFLHNISHEIRTPMNAIVGFSALLSESEVDAQTCKSYIEVIMQSSDHLLAIITDIVDISNIEANLVKTAKNEINLNSTLKSLCNQFMPKAHEKKIQLVCEPGLSSSEAFILTDNTKLTQILSNLIGNALKFTNKGYINVGYKVKDGFLEFSVSDTGIGIPDEYHEKIFYRFYQVQNTVSRIYEGTGLGLAISKAYVELLGGNIWLDSEKETGATFYFTIPYERSVSAREVAPEISISEKKVFKNKKTILVAEDVDSNFKLLKYFLSDPNIELLRAENGKEAVEQCLSGTHIDLILMDIKMPVMDGYTAAKIIRESMPGIPIIAQTAYADDQNKAKECGCDGFISKPFDKKRLMKVLAEFI
jgi:PAS domain S-box-containing protein